MTSTEGSSALSTDLYELTMLDAALADGTADRPATFEAYARRLPDGVPYGIVAGTDRVVDAVLDFRFTAEQLEWLRSTGQLSERCLTWLLAFRFGGRVHVRREGEVWGAGSPIVTVDGTFAEGVIFETVILSTLNHAMTVATTAAGMVRAAAGRPLIEMGGRRTHEAAAVDAARAAWIAGFAATSNLAAGHRYGIPVTGTAAHAWTLAHTEEVEAFVAQMTTLGTDTTLLVDTYDIPAGIAAAVAAAHRLGVPGPGGVRIDSGRPEEVVPAARRQLDDLGATGTRIVISGDLDADRIAAAVGAGLPVDGFGVGTRLVAAPPVGFVYKLTEISDGAGTVRRVAKRSSGKATVGGAKRAFRLAADGVELVVPAGRAAELLAGRVDAEPLDSLAILDGLDRREGTLAGRTVVARERAARHPGATPLVVTLAGFTDPLPESTNQEATA